VVPSEGCRDRRLASVHISNRILCNTDSIPLFRVHAFMAGNFVPFTTPVLLSTHVILILDTNRTVGGTAGYSSGHVIRNS
jgi:hypothetical protein